ncbi:MAG: sigma-54 dependent transcriptional regulator [Acidobacteria bacterium]|nr:sigma-54 dependent transcriptional regulator [Acidobacteriota bacterium]
MSQILVVDDDAGIRMTLTEALGRGGHRVRTAASGVETLSLIEQEPAEVVILDMVLPGIDGLQLLQDLHRQHLGLPVIMITGHASVGSAISAMKMGAFDYLVKPFRLEEVELVVRKALEQSRLRHEDHRLRQRLVDHGPGGLLIGESSAMRRMLELVERIAPTRSTVLVTGASGTGKELVARAIHTRSDRSDGPFVAVNCGALPESLLEDELFGHVRGAFTDAVSDRPGCFMQADGGTLFLDEIATMSPGLQVKLLRVLQERELMPLGSTRKVRVDVRIIAATNINIRDSVARREFREDLYYRLNVINIELPPLRDRGEDIPLLVRHFIDKHPGKLGSELVKFSRDALCRLRAYPWPGNVRQLENVVELCVALAPQDGVLGVELLPEEIAGSVEPPPEAVEVADGQVDLDKLVREYEQRIICRALKDNGWVKTRAANRLNIKRTTLVEKMKRLGIPLRGVVNKQVTS